MNTWKVILATLVIFASGVITGGLLEKHFGAASKPAPAEVSKHGGTNSAASRIQRPVLAANLLRAKDFLERLDHELKLTPEQREHIEQIISEGQENFKSICQDALADTRERILNELTPEQQTQFTELLKRKPVPAHPATNSPSATGTNAPVKKP